MREARTCTPPTVISRHDSIPKPSPETSSSVIEESTSRATGPQRPMVEISSVRSVSVVPAVVGELRR